MENQSLQGGRETWIQRQREKSKVKEKAEPVAAKTEKVEQVTKPKKLSYKLQRELEQLPETLEKLENEITELQEKVNDASFFQQNPKKTDEVLGRLAEAEQELEVAFERWEELEALQQEVK